VISISRCTKSSWKACSSSAVISRSPSPSMTLAEAPDPDSEGARGANEDGEFSSAQTRRRLGRATRRRTEAL